LKGWKVGGWKVGGLESWRVEKLRENRVTGKIPENRF